MLLTPYEDKDPWLMAVTKHKGVSVCLFGCLFAFYLPFVGWFVLFVFWLVFCLFFSLFDDCFSVFLVCLS